MKQHRLTDKEKIEVVEQYQQGKSSIQISNKFCISPAAICGLLDRRNIKRRSQSKARRIYKINENYFDEINTQDKAYFLGFLYADGYNNELRNSIALSLKESDKEILEKLNALLQPTKPLQYIKYENQNRESHYRLLINNKHISETLAKHGVIQAKTFKLTFPHWLSDNLKSHFIRGYFDGDGSITYKIPKNKKIIQGQLSIVSTESFCNSLIKLFEKELDINSYIETRHPERKHNIRQLRISGNLQILKFLIWIYNKSTIHLNRKYNKYLKIKNRFD